LAAVHRTPGHPDIEYFQTNVSGALNIVDWCERVSAQCLLFTSSISVYGVDPGAKSENSTLNPSGAYGFSKKFAEEIQTSWQSKSPTNRRLIICRPAVMFGAGEKGNFTRLAKGLKYRYFFFPNGPDTLKACGFVEDLIASFIFVLDQDENFVLFNFCYPENYTIGQICTTFNLVTGAKYPHSLPGKRVASFLLHFGKPWDLLASRAMKLITDTEINPLYLEHQGFEWGSNIQSALQKWFDLNRIDGIY